MVVFLLNILCIVRIYRKLTNFMLAGNILQSFSFMQAWDQQYEQIFILITWFFFEKKKKLKSILGSFLVICKKCLFLQICQAHFFKDNERRTIGNLERGIHFIPYILQTYLEMPYFYPSVCHVLSLFSLP